jgi:Ca2+-binding RTX toxin-like protein
LRVGKRRANTDSFGAGDRIKVFNGQTGPFSITESGGSTILAATGEGQTGSVVIDAVGLVRSENDISSTFTFGSSTVALGAPPPAWPQVVPNDEPPSPKDVWGTTGNDTISGAASRERIFAGGGDDRVTGNNGDDLIYGGGGADRLRGSTGLTASSAERETM